MDDAGLSEGCGVYGKLPSKRDFIAARIAAPVLTVLETWLQGGIAASKNKMGGDWQQAFLTAPIWRFWLGEQIAGTFCVGAVMPSVDGVGRYFPLTILSHGRPGEILLPPLDDPLDAWFDPVEGRLLSALDPALSFEANSFLQDLQGARSCAKPASETTSTALRRGAIWSADPAEGAGPGGDRDEDYRIAAQARTYWWTKGGARFGPRFYSHPGMPDPVVYVNMMTGEVGSC